VRAEKLLLLSRAQKIEGPYYYYSGVQIGMGKKNPNQARKKIGKKSASRQRHV
jgi:beta-xylosidase